MTSARPQRLAPFDGSGPEWIHSGLRARGTIVDQPIAGQFLLHLEERTTGTLRLQRGKIRKDIFFHDGRPVGSASNIRHEALGALLVAQGILDDAQLTFLLSEVRRTGGKMGEVLVQLGWLGPEDVLRFLSAQARRRLADAMRWVEGEFELVADSDFLAEVIDHAEDVPRLVFAALKKTSEPDRVGAWLAREHAGDAARLSPRFSAYRTAFADVFGPALLDSGWFTAAAGGGEAHRMAMGKWLSGAHSREIAGAAETLWLAGLLEFVSAGRATAATPGMGVQGLDPQSLEQLRAAPTAGDDSAYDLYAPVPVDVQEASPMQEFEDVPSGVIALHSRVRSAVPPIPSGGANRATVGADQGSRVAAEIDFTEARALLAQGGRDQALTLLESAVRAAPDESAYRATLGWTLFEAGGTRGLIQAREHLQAAVALDPGNAEAHEWLGHVAAAAGNPDAARDAFARAMQIDPERLGAARWLLDGLDRSGQHPIAESSCRQWIAALGQRALPVRLALWLHLAGLYENKLGNQPAARLAYDVAARLAPDNLELQRKVVALNAHDLDHWKDSARALSAEWRQRPDDGGLGCDLRDLYLRVGKRDGASIVAAAMCLRGTASDIDRQLVDRHRQHDLTPLVRPIDDAIWSILRHRDENAAIEALFDRLVAAGVLPVGADDQDRPSGGAVVTAAQQPPPFRRVFQYLCRAFGFEEAPWLVRLPPSGRTGPNPHARVVDAEPVTIAVSPELLASTDTLMIGFRLARVFSLAAPARAAAANRSGRTLRPYLVASLGLPIKPGPAAATPSADDAALVQSRLAACPRAVRDQLGTCARTLVAAQATIDLSSWAKAVRFTADRAGLLICRDLEIAARLAAADGGPEAAESLLDFALSPEHIELRGDLGFVTVNEPGPAVAGSERRRATRVDLEVEIGLESDSNFYTGILQDISTGGIFVATHQIHAVGERLKIKLRLPNEAEPVEVETEVRWVREESPARRGQGEAMGMGLRFIAPDPRLVDASARFMRRRESLLYDDD